MNTRVLLALGCSARTYMRLLYACRVVGELANFGCWLGVEVPKGLGDGLVSVQGSVDCSGVQCVVLVRACMTLFNSVVKCSYWQHEHVALLPRKVSIAGVYACVKGESMSTKHLQSRPRTQCLCGAENSCQHSTAYQLGTVVSVAGCDSIRLGWKTPGIPWYCNHFFSRRIVWESSKVIETGGQGGCEMMEAPNLCCGVACRVIGVMLHRQSLSESLRDARELE